MRIAVVTDSTSDLPSDLAAAYQIHVIPTILVINGKSLEDGRGISRRSFYQQLPNMKPSPTTASPASGAYIQLYKRLKREGYDHVVAIHVSSTLSGVYDAAQAVARDFDGFVHVVDSQQLSMGIGFQVLAAAKTAREDSDLETVIAAAHQIRQKARVMAMLDSLEYVRRSGRVSWLQANIGQVLQVKPFLALRDGNLTRNGEVRSRHKGIHRLYQYLTDLGPLEHLAILHTTPATDAIEMANYFASQTRHPPIFVEVTPIIGVHVGPNGLGFAAIVQ